MATAPLQANTPAPPQAVAAGYTNLVLDDEFNDPSTVGAFGSGAFWTPDGAFGTSGDVAGSTATVANGILTITAGPGGGGSGFNLTTANWSVGSGAPGPYTGYYQYGYYQIRALSTDLTTLWLWSSNPGKWTTAGQPVSPSPSAPSTWFGEIDIQESNQDIANRVNTTIHTNTQSYGGVSDSPTGTAYTASSPVINGWHTYGVLWTPTTLSFYLDGSTTPYFTENYTNLPGGGASLQQPMEILLSAMNPFGTGQWGGTPTQPVITQVDYVHVWQQGTSPTPTPTPTPPPSPSVSADGSALHAGDSGSLVTSDGTWTFSTDTASGGNVILLNGQHATNGAATELLVDNGGHLFADNVAGNWYEWVNSNWVATTDPTATSASGVTSGATSGAGSTSISADGSALHAGDSGSLVTSDGTWTFSTDTAPGGNVILLNGQHATSGAATELLVDNGGHLFADNVAGNWYEWVNSNWVATTDPTATSASGATAPTTDPTADGSILKVGSGGSLTTSDGTWTFGANPAPGGTAILLNGQPATNGAATTLVVDNQGHLLADNVDGNWYEWTGGNWSQLHPAAMQAGSGTTAGSGTSAPPTLTPSFVDAAGHDIFVFSPGQSGVQIANFNASEDILDLTSLLKADGYNGTNPIADHVVSLVQSSTGTSVMVDPTGHDPNHGTTVVTLDHVLPQNVNTAHIWH